MMHHLTGVDVYNTTSVAIYYETHAIPQRLNAGIICASILVSILGSYASLFLLGKRTSNSGTRNIVLLILAATTMAFVGLWSMHFIGMYMRLEATMNINWYIRYNPGFAVFSFIAPAIALIVSFLFLDHDADGFRFWKVSLAGTLTGCTVALMHYSASFYCNFHVTFAPAQVVGSIILACVLCIVGFTAFFRFRYQWQDSWWKRGFCAIVLGLGVAGMHYVGVSGTEYRVKWNQMNGSDLTTGKRRNLILVCIIAVICFLVLLGIAIAAMMDVAVKQNSRKKARTLVVASATFDRNGRLMVNGDGTLPLTTVQERTLRRSQVLQALDQRSSVFHWLYAVSWDWSIVTPFLDAISSRIFDAEKKNYIANQRDMLTRAQKARRVFVKGSTDVTHDASQSQTSLLDFRDKVIGAAYRLAQDLEVALPDLGVFHDYILPTGTRKAAEKALAKDPFPNRRSGSISSTRPDFDEELRVGNRPESIFGKGEDEQEGVTMFIVREVDQDEVNQLAKRGFRFTETRFLGNILADRHGVLKEEMDKTLEALRMYAKRGTKPIVQPGGYYAGLFCVRPNPLYQNGSLDVLVYDFARHQIPAFRLPQVTCLTAEIVSFLKSLDQIPMERVLQLCQQDSSHLLEQKKRIAKLLEFNVKVADKEQLEEEQIAVDALVQFQQNLYSAIKTLHQTMYFLPDLLHTSKFSAKMVELPSSLVDPDAAPAHMVLVQAILPAADKQLKRSQDDIQHSPPYMFTPYNLFAKTQMMMLGGPPADEFEREVVNELERRYKLQEVSVEMSEGKTPTVDEEAKEVDVMSDVSKTSRPNTHILTFNRAGPPSAIGTHRLSILEEQSVPSASSLSASAYGEGVVRKSPSQVLGIRRFPQSSTRNSVGQAADSSIAKTLSDGKANGSEGTQNDDCSRSSSLGEVEMMSNLNQTIAPVPLSSPSPRRKAINLPPEQSPRLSSRGSMSPRKRRSLANMAASSSAQQVAAQLFTMEESSDTCTIQVTSDHWQIEQLEELKKGQPDLMSGITPSEC
jgi:NO-binding membrane sensor protein with MHYT domain